MNTSGVIREDPSGENQAPCFVRILRNDQQVWPKEGWAEVLPNDDTPTNYEIMNLKASAGDKLRFVVKHNGENRSDLIVWDPMIVIRVRERSQATAQSSQ